MCVPMRGRRGLFFTAEIRRETETKTQRDTGEQVNRIREPETGREKRRSGDDTKNQEGRGRDSGP